MSDTTPGGNTMQETTQQGDEIWQCIFITDEDIFFSVENDSTEEVRSEIISRTDFPQFMADGGYPAIMANVLLLGNKAGWKFRKIWNGHIYLDGPSTSGNDEYHPIDKPVPDAFTDTLEDPAPRASDGDAAD